MTISFFLKHVENDLSMLSCHQYGPIKLFPVNENQNDHEQVPNFLSYMHFFYFCQLDINMSFVLSICIIILFSRHQISSKFKVCCRLLSNIKLFKQYTKISYYQHTNPHFKLNPQ